MPTTTVPDNTPVFKILRKDGSSMPKAGIYGKLQPCETFFLIFPETAQDHEFSLDSYCRSGRYAAPALLINDVFLPLEVERKVLYGLAE
jgi:hypothetical protein